MRRFWHPLVAEIQLIKTKFYKETNSSDSLLSKIEVPRVFETQKVRRHDKFKKEWSQH